LVYEIQGDVFSKKQHLLKIKLEHVLYHITLHFKVLTHTKHTTVPQKTEIQFCYSGMAYNQPLHANMRIVK